MQHFVMEVVFPTSAQKIEVVWVDVKSPTGSFMIGPQSSPLVSLLSANSKLLFKSETGSMGTIEIPAGMLEIDENGNVLVLVVPSLAT